MAEKNRPSDGRDHHELMLLSYVRRPTLLIGLVHTAAVTCIKQAEIIDVVVVHCVPKK